MLEVTELRIGSYEISDQFLNEDRDRFVQYRLGNKIIMGISIFLILSQFILLLGEFRWISIIALFFGVIGIIISLKIEMMIRHNLRQHLSGFVIEFDEERRLKDLHVREWKENSNDEYIEKSVRFNQAIGFQAILDDEGLINIEIIVDPDFPGTTIFQSYDFFTLAELLLLFQKTLPNKDKWFYKTIDGESWPEGYKQEFNEEVLVARTPWIIHDFFT
ncbi:MAG: hypothetical protein ACXAD7_08535 [Candidatus Kariarchaeaceae archaeon]|jgi:hypothetical protein